MNQVKGHGDEKKLSTEVAHELLMQAPVIIAIIKGENQVIELANDRMLEIWGKSKSVIGQPLAEAIPELAVQGYVQMLHEVRKTGKPYHAFEAPTSLNRNGTTEVRYFNFLYQPYYEGSREGEATGVIAVAHDVTEQLQSRQRVKNIIEQAADPILILKGEDMVLEVANEALFKLWRTDESAIGRAFLEILPEMKGQGFLELLQKVYHTGEPFHGFEIPAVFEDADEGKRIVYFNFTYQPYREPDGTTSGVLVLASDVTGQVLAKQNLVESERNLRNTILQAPVAMCILRGPSYTIEVANKPMVEMWGKTEQEVLHKPAFVAVPEAKNQGLEELLHKVYTTGERFSAAEMAVTLPREHGLENIFVNFVYEPLRQGDGQINGIIAVAVDVTEQVATRKKVEESEMRFRTLANSISQLAWIADAEGNLYWYNDRWYEYTGASLEEMRGWGWQKVHHPDHVSRVVEYVTDAWKRPEPIELTFPLRRKDGVYRWFLTRAYPVLDEDGKILQWIGTNTDIDEQKQIEAHLEEKVHSRTVELQSHRSLLDNLLVNSSNGISVTEMVRDENGTIIDATTILANEAAIKFTGLPREIYLSKSARELDPEILNSPYGKTCLKTLETGEPSFIQYFLEFSGRWLELTVSKMDDNHLIHIFTDVTPIKEAQLQLERTVGELKKSNANLEEFAYAASHDLKEPIRKIRFFSDKLKTQLMGRLKPDEVQTFERMEMAGARMGSLIDDLLSYSYVSLRPGTFDSVNLNEIINLVMGDLDLEIEQKKASIEVGKLFTIKGHHRQLQQAFQNLLANALKYSKAGDAPRITISGRVVAGKTLPVPAESQCEKYCEITIKDSGIGFRQEDAERIFNVFTRLHATPEYRGTGVGLSIVRKVIENHDGYITAESSPGEGATFRIYLPAD